MSLLEVSTLQNMLSNDTLGTYCESVYAGKTSGLDAMDKFRQEAAELMKQGD